MIELVIGICEGKGLDLIHDRSEVGIKFLECVYGLFDTVHQILIDIRRYVLVYCHCSFLCREMTDVVRDAEWQDDHYHTLNFRNLTECRLVSVASAVWRLLIVDSCLRVK